MAFRFDFNISPSSLTEFETSEVMFVFNKILKLDPDTVVNTAYSSSGNCVHHAIEHYIKHRDRDAATKFFIDEWTKEMKGKYGFKGDTLSKQAYYDAFIRACDMVDNQYVVEASEKEIVIPSGIEGLNYKGIIDVVVTENGIKKIVDWKTSSNKDTGKAFRRQVLMYSFLYWRLTGEFILHSKIEYVKIAEVSEFSFTEKEILNFEKDALIPVIEKIKNYGSDFHKYSLGSWDSNFNQHRKKCANEQRRRDNETLIFATRKGNRLFFDEIPNDLIKTFNVYFSYMVENYFHTPQFKSGVWDGSKKFYKKQSLPYAFYWKIIDILDEFNKIKKTNYKLEVKDARDERIVNKVYKTIFKESDVILRPYQLDALEVMDDKKVGIIFGGTGSGKTLLSAEFIKRKNRRTLFIVNRIELVRQTIEEFESYLGVKVGECSEGNLDVSKQITVASIQTLYAILERKDETTRELAIYLHNVTNVIFDEAQNVAGDSAMYGTLADSLSNVEYNIALSGSPFRNGTDTLEMNSLCGFVIFTKTTEELIKEGYLCPVKTTFLSMPPPKYAMESGDYHKDYETFVVKHDLRNEVIADIVQNNRHKKIIILVNRIEHGEILNGMIPNSFFLYGSTPKEQRKEKFKEFKDGDGLVLISMIKIVGAGINIPNLDILMVASAHGSDVDTTQIIGRLLRNSPGKKFGYYIDFADEEVFKGMARKRIKMLQAYGHKVDLIYYTDWKEKIDFG